MQEPKHIVCIFHSVGSIPAWFLTPRPSTCRSRVLTGMYLGAQKTHPIYVERLPLGILFPMKTSHSMPIMAAAVAVATPCCPAPVSAIRRGLAHLLRQKRLSQARY